MRPAECGDASHIVEMMQRFHDHAKPKFCIDERDALEFVLHRIADAESFVAVTGSGFIIGMISENPLNRRWKIASEFLWWAEDGKGAALLAGFRRWAKSNGAREIYYSCPDGETRVRRFFGRIANAAEAVYSEVV